MPATAIIPAYNEAPRIGRVLRAVRGALQVTEVIVIDDGSRDNLAEVVARFPEVQYIRNRKNRGKGWCMEKGSCMAQNDILLFCDSDLTGLTAKMVDRVVRPVADGRCDMYVGMFHTPGRQFYDTLLKMTAFPSGMNSGLRAMRRHVWDSLPAYYKRSYYTESGLNYLVKWNFRGPQYAQLSYTQTPKEKKYGWWEGSYLRWKMNLEVTLAFLRVHLYERLFGFGRGAVGR